MTLEFCPLACQTQYSLLEGLVSPAELVRAAAVRGAPAVGIADRLYLTGVVEFERACRETGLQPVYGLTVDAVGVGSVRLYAASRVGWSNLCRISSTLMLREMDTPQADLDLLAPFSQDVIAVIPFEAERGTHSLSQWKDAFQSACYVGLGGSEVSIRSAALAAQEVGLPAVYLPEIRATRPEQAQRLRLLSAIRHNAPVGEMPEVGGPGREVHLPEPWELARFRERTEWLRASLEIAERCRVELPLGRPNLPHLEFAAGETPASVLRRKAEEGARKLYGRITAEIQARLDHELATIAGLGFEPVFLIVEDLIAYAREADIPVSSRGSAASSLVAHCLGITSPDPLELNLYFERFLNPARVTPPDIDTDICSRGRDAVIRHVFETFGEERVAMVGTINRYRPRSALADAAKAHGLSAPLVREMASLLPYAFFSRREEDAEGGEAAFDGLREQYPHLRPVLDDAASLLNLPRHLSVHAGGLVVAPGRLTDLVPVMRSGAKGVTITQLDLESVEAFGLIKIDLLGIRGLTVLGDVAGAIRSWRRAEVKSALSVLDTIPEEEEATSERICQGQTIGCFQIESPGMRAILKDIQARTPRDIMAGLALYRPGPLQGGLKDAFVRRFRGEEPVKHIHPAMAGLLEETYGVILYQEQVLRIAHQLAGLSLAEADLLRRAMSHFDPGRQMVLLKEKFLAGVEAHSGIPRETGEKVWEMMAAFAGYGFPKAHAASYAQVAWRSAWCKTHFPAEFMAAVLANWGGYYSQRVYLSEARRMGLILKPPAVNHARPQFSAAYPGGEAVLYMGLDQVKDLTRRTIQRILSKRPFHSMEDFLARVDPHKKEAENLIRAGALDDLGLPEALLRRVQGGGWMAGQPVLFDAERGTEADEWDAARRAEEQEAVLGISVDVHPLELKIERIRKANAIGTLEALSRIGKRVCVAGVRQSSHRSQSVKGGWMMFLTLEDLEGTLDAVVFPDIYRRERNTLSTTQPLLLWGMMQKDEQGGEPTLRVERVERV